MKERLEVKIHKFENKIENEKQKNKPKLTKAM